MQLKEVCEKALISEHSKLMWDEFGTLLELDRTDGELVVAVHRELS